MIVFVYGGKEKIDNSKKRKKPILPVEQRTWKSVPRLRKNFDAK